MKTTKSAKSPNADNRRHQRVRPGTVALRRAASEHNLAHISLKRTLHTPVKRARSTEADTRHGHNLASSSSDAEVSL